MRGEPCVCSPGSWAWVGKVAGSRHPSGCPAELSPPGHQLGREHWENLQERNPEAQLPPQGAGVESCSGLGLGGSRSRGGARLRPRRGTRRPACCSRNPDRCLAGGLVVCCRWDEDRGFLPEGGKPPHIQWLRPRRVIRPGVPEAHLTSDPAHSTPRDPLTLSEALHAAVAGGPRS